MNLGGASSTPDLSNLTATSFDVMQGKKVYGPSGLITGTAPFEYIPDTNSYKMLQSEMIVKDPLDRVRTLRVDNAIYLL